MPASATRGEAMLDRAVELSRLERLLEDAGGGTGRLALIEGPPGIGKTRLLHEARRRAQAHGLTPLGARGSELERSFGFGIVHQLLDPAVRATTAQERRRLMSGAARLAKPLFDRSPGDVQAPGDPSYGMLHGLYWLVANLAERAPLFIAIDDAHWGDGPSGRFLEFLARRLEGMPVAVAVASRGGQEGSDLVSENVRQSAERIELQPLGYDAVRDLVRDRLGGQAGEDLCAACGDATGGNPFLAHELLEELVRRRAAGQDLRPAAVERLGPKEVAAATLARVGRVPGAAALARAVAVLGDGADVHEAATLADMDPLEAARVADALAAAVIIEAGRPLRFMHPIVRAAVYDEVPAAVRGEMHARAARLAAERGAASDVVAAHLLQTEPRGEAATVDILRRAAGMALARGAPEPAVAYLRRALAEPPPGPLRPALLHELGVALAQLGAPESRELLGAAFELASDPDARAAIGLDLAQGLLITGELPEAVKVLTIVLEGRPGASPALAGRLEGMLLLFGTTAVSGRRLLRQRLAEALQRLEGMPAEQARFLLPGLSFDRAVGRGCDAEAATALARRALANGDLIRADSSDASVASGATETLWVTGRYAESESSLDVLVQNAQARGSARGFAMASALRSWTRYLRGALREAEVDARACLELATHPTWALFNPLAGAVLGAVLLERGDIDAAQRAVGPFQQFRDDDDFGFVQILHTVEARIHLAAGDPGQALAAVAPCRRFESGWGANAGLACAIPWRSPAALAHLPQGNRSEALSLAEEQLRLARDFGVPRPLGVALCVLADVAGGARSLDLLDEAAAVLEGADAHVEHARALVGLGAALRRAGRPLDARRRLTAGMDLAHRWGAAALAAQAREELIASGARPRRLATSGADALTAGERRVARMAGEGMTNREIAQALFVTLRTVEGHLTNAFRKLGIDSREALPDALDFNRA